jgi:prophage DNA circulation protein
VNKFDSKEATPIMQRALRELLTAAPTRGRAGSDLRTACGRLMATAAILIQRDEAGQPLADCFELAYKTGVTQKQISYVRSTVVAEAPVSVGGLLIKNSIIEMCLSVEGRVIADMDFTTRGEVEQMMLTMNEAFGAAEEVAANDMDAMTYRALISLHASITFFLTETARPLPRLIRFAFAASMPTLVTAQRLYYDAGRADELRQENRVVHPAFMRATGQALSA